MSDELHDVLGSFEVGFSEEHAEHGELQGACVYCFCRAPDLALATRQMLDALRSDHFTVKNIEFVSYFHTLDFAAADRRYFADKFAELADNVVEYDDFYAYEVDDRLN